jgi:hypothetical protein
VSFGKAPCELRRQLGPTPLKALFDVVAGPLAPRPRSTATPTHHRTETSESSHYFELHRFGQSLIYARTTESEDDFAAHPLVQISPLGRWRR